MKDHLSTSIIARELGDHTVRSRSYRKLYGDRRLIAELDIVNELDGHSGCVNALSWSKSGLLLASGSDDQHLNIHRYQSANSTNQFQLATTVATGHTQNIFSVKFMPHHNDRIVITAAGDGEVRVFDLEYAGQTREASAAAAFASEGRKRGRNTIYNGVRYLSDGDTDCRVYRSHGDRVKRIVTESSPYLFLTCSEDGEVRQWDLRQPSSAYPPPRSGRFGGTTDNSVPPPLISYRRYNLDLNTISCSPAQPHYIALGGAHLHAFLHDRRMTGRDRLREAGKPLSPSRSMNAEDQELMRQATQCVRKFAPHGQQRMRRTENGHITALKISDARPDEMVVSWSGDHIYSFDLIRSPDTTETSQVKASRDRKRKRQAASDSSFGQQDSPVQSSSGLRSERGATAMRIQYQNGQSEDIPLQTAPHGRSPLTEKQRRAQRIAKATVKLRSSLFETATEDEDDTAPFTAALGVAASILSDIDEVIGDWRYPIEPTAETVMIERILRSRRENVRHFVQASGTIARALGGKLRTASAAPSPLLSHFASIEARGNDLPLEQGQQFSYDFLKAILLWLESGIGRLIEGFTRPSEMLATVRAAYRLPIPEAEATTEAIDDILIPYLLSLASAKPIINVESNRFETDDRRQVFPSEEAAVLAFAAAVKIPFADLSSEVILAEQATHIEAQDREVATRFWGRKVARGVLLNAAEGVDFNFVNEAFGSVSGALQEVVTTEDRLAEIDGDEDTLVRNVTLTDAAGGTVEVATAEDIALATQDSRTQRRSQPASLHPDDDDGSGDNEEFDVVMYEGHHDDDHDEDDDDDDNSGEDGGEDDSSELDEVDGVPIIPGFPRFMFNSAFERRRNKEKVEADVPCHASTRVYRGHCNVRTVKDVNFFGLEDEYVVSGSDDGNFFIWDRKTAELVNVLEGDGEVVNVIQGHPYETMLAVSGIDHTIKIFSPDVRARMRARLGDGVSAHDDTAFSSLAWPQRLGRRAGRRSRTANAETTTVMSEPAVPASTTSAIEDDDFVAPNGLASRKRMHDAYSITSKNDAERQGGNQDAYITVPHVQLLHMLFGGMGNMAVFPSFE